MSWVTYYNTQRPHQALADATPESRFNGGVVRRELKSRPERNGEQWVSRTVASNGLVCVGHQQVSVGKHFGGSPCDAPFGFPSGGPAQLRAAEFLKAWRSRPIIRLAGRMMQQSALATWRRPTAWECS